MSNFDQRGGTGSSTLVPSPPASAVIGRLRALATALMKAAAITHVDVYPLTGHRAGKREDNAMIKSS
jgi:hypothetical protein